MIDTGLRSIVLSDDAGSLFFFETVFAVVILIDVDVLNVQKTYSIVDIFDLLEGCFVQ